MSTPRAFPAARIGSGNGSHPPESPSPALLACSGAEEIHREVDAFSSCPALKARGGSSESEQNRVEIFCNPHGTPQQLATGSKRIPSARNCSRGLDVALFQFEPGVPSGASAYPSAFSNTVTQCPARFSCCARQGRGAGTDDGDPLPDGFPEVGVNPPSRNALSRCSSR